jgi:hypothetical protein
VTAGREPQLPEITDRRHPSRHQAGQEPREQLVQNLRAAGQQPVSVSALRHALARHPRLRQHVTLDHRHLLEGIGQHPGRQQPAHAPPKHHRFPAGLLHFLPPGTGPGTPASPADAGKPANR